MAIYTFPISYETMETMVQCNESRFVKKYVEIDINICVKFQLHPPHGCLEKKSKITLYVAMATFQIQLFRQNHMKHTVQFKKHFSSPEPNAHKVSL